MSTKTAYLITDIEEYGKFISFCIDNDVCVFGHIGTKMRKATDVIR
ncbi:MAG: hypothetical protein SOX69_09645 [Oscillospiraceae bacterium]|nr:hypothetical protein [Oscillospiraceae bacterium]